MIVIVNVLFALILLGISQKIVDFLSSVFGLEDEGWFWVILVVVFVVGFSILNSVIAPALGLSTPSPTEDYVYPI